MATFDQPNWDPTANASPPPNAPAGTSWTNPRTGKTLYHNGKGAWIPKDNYDYQASGGNSGGGNWFTNRSSSAPRTNQSAVTSPAGGMVGSGNDHVLHENPVTGQGGQAGGQYGHQPQQPPTTGAPPPNQNPGQGNGGVANQPGQSWQYQGQGYQNQTRTAPQAWGGQTAGKPPPPPPLPGMPMPAPNFQQIAGQAGAATMGPQYQTAAGSWQGEESLPGLQAFSTDWMKNYNPFGSGAGAAGVAELQERMMQQRMEDTRGIEELMASRGTIGSNIETDARINANEAATRNQLLEEFALQEMMGRFELEGRGSAGNFGLNVGEFGRSLGGDRRDEGRFQYDADRTRGRDFEDDKRFRTSTGLQAAGMQDDSELSRYYADLEGKQFQEGATMDRAKLERQDDELNLRAHAIQQDAIQRGQEMDLSEARYRAENELQQNKMSQDEIQFGRNLDQNESQFGRELTERGRISDRDFGLREREAEEARRRNEFLEDLGILDYLERRDGGNTDDEEQPDAAQGPNFDGTTEGETVTIAGEPPLAPTTWVWRNGKWHREGATAGRAGH